MKQLLLAAVLVFAGAVSQAEEHTLGTMKGEPGIDLKVYDHAMAGSVKDFVIWGNVDEATNTATLIMKKDAQEVKATFAQDQATKKIGGTIQHSTDTKTFSTTIEFAGIDKNKQQIAYKINGKDVVVSITADAFANNHFKNPTYTTTIDGQTVTYKLEGQACYRFSTFLSFIILGAVAH